MRTVGFMGLPVKINETLVTAIVANSAIIILETIFWQDHRLVTWLLADDIGLVFIMNVMLWKDMVHGK